MSLETIRKIRSLGGEGILSTDDVVGLGEATMRVLTLMADGEWHDADKIRRAAGDNGVPAPEGLRRLRELRRAFDVEKVRQRDFKRRWAYRLKLKGTLF